MEAVDLMQTVEICVLGEFDPHYEPHIATNSSIGAASKHLGAKVLPTWVSTAEIDLSELKRFDGIWVAPGSPYRSLPKTLEAIRFARECEVPLLGTCGGFQHIILEYAQNVLGFSDAAHAEYDPYASILFISKLKCSLVGRWMDLTFQENSTVSRAYGCLTTQERYYCNFGVNPLYSHLLRDGLFHTVGSDGEGEVRVVEITTHPFFVGTLFVPQMKSSQVQPHPLVACFIEAACRHAVVRK